jgi:hypothetical protein
MKIRSQLDSILSGGAGEALGRLLIEYQGLEAAVRTSLEVAYLPIDPLNVIAILAKGQTTARKIEIAKEVLQHAAEKYRVPQVPFTGAFPFEFLAEDKDANKQIAQAFAGILETFTNVGNLLKYRNNLFHGSVGIVGSELQFVESKSRQIVANAGNFRRSRQEVRWITFNLLTASQSLSLALAFLRETHAETQ